MPSWYGIGPHELNGSSAGWQARAMAELHPRSHRGGQGFKSRPRRQEVQVRGLIARRRPGLTDRLSAGSGPDGRHQAGASGMERHRGRAVQRTS